jgi:hypothetical protein
MFQTTIHTPVSTATLSDVSTVEHVSLHNLEPKHTSYLKSFLNLSSHTIRKALLMNYNTAFTETENKHWK